MIASRKKRKNADEIEVKLIKIQGVSIDLLKLFVAMTVNGDKYKKAKAIYATYRRFLINQQSSIQFSSIFVVKNEQNEDGTIKERVIIDFEKLNSVAEMYSKSKLSNSR